MPPKPKQPPAATAKLKGPAKQAPSTAAAVFGPLCDSLGLPRLTSKAALQLLADGAVRDAAGTTPVEALERAAALTWARHACQNDPALWESVLDSQQQGTLLGLYATKPVGAGLPWYSRLVEMVTICGPSPAASPEKPDPKRRPRSRLGPSTD